MLLFNMLHILKVSEVIANCEGDKLTLQQHQTAGMQQLLEETEQRLHKVEEDHSRQSQSLVRKN